MRTAGPGATTEKPAAAAGRGPTPVMRSGSRRLSSQRETFML
jgi:hypothetical protein